MWKTAFEKLWIDMISLGRPYHFKFFKGCLPRILLGPFLYTLTHMFACPHPFRASVPRNFNSFLCTAKQWPVLESLFNKVAGLRLQHRKRDFNTEMKANIDVKWIKNKSHYGKFLHFISNIKENPEFRRWLISSFKLILN